MIIGIDIGTTTISAVVADIKNRTVLKSVTIPNKSLIQSPVKYHRLQDPEIIYQIVKGIVSDFKSSFDITRIGMTGQMHGILYINKEGIAVSPLYTWQDESGYCLFDNSDTFCDHIKKQTGYSTASGFGTVTHYYLQTKKQIPEDAVFLCTIGDYIAIRLANKKTPVFQSSNAASLGIYNIEKNCFDNKALGLLGIDTTFFPEVEKGCRAVGTTEDEITVSIAIGDNQASFLGATENFENNILLNLGTGGQISCHSEKYITGKNFETRPFINDSYLLAASSLCGGRAYAALEKFFRLTLKMAGVERDNIYGNMSNLIENIEVDNPLSVNTLFCGTRENPELSGSIGNIDLNNLTPQHFIHGFADGIVKELYPAYQEFCKQKTFSSITASGNTVRKNKYFQKIIETVYSLPVKISKFPEEAAFGAAVYAGFIKP